MCAACPLITLLKPTIHKGGVSVDSLSTSLSSLDNEFSFPTSMAWHLFKYAYSLILHCLSFESLLYIISMEASGLTKIDFMLCPICIQKFYLIIINSPSMGHPGTAWMLPCLYWTYYWPNMRVVVVLFVSICDSCQRFKIDTKASVWKLQPLPIPCCLWSVIGMDFVVKLAFANVFDSISVIVYHLTRGAHFIPCCKSMNAEKLATPFIQQFF